MHLIQLKNDNGWTQSQWELTYRVSWEQILKGIAYAYEYYDGFEIMVDNKPVAIEKKEDIENIPEAGNICFRGMSKVLKVPIMITLYNQLSTVNVAVAQATDEFKTVSYVNLNHSLCQYMDSLEINMHI
ncbi:MULTISPECIES: hypothetical protein [unclassified Butyrivibrio]|uniref:hypothetical protein n=1 Tax=unclassified Butyrivibrio TaxID=2639466 RepID=UPI00042A2183|nr:MULTISPECIES: hypothetical protein [unclassified Butyrivibrio]SEL31068.1 hypothetical protein SAMN04487770_108128 [Butyrivibrio sp. ob235]